MEVKQNMINYSVRCFAGVSKRWFLVGIVSLLLSFPLSGQVGQAIQWTADGYGVRELDGDEIIVQSLLDTNDRKVIVRKELLTPEESDKPLLVRRYAFSSDGSRVLINTNTRRVWRHDTRGDYWLVDLSEETL